MMKIWAYSFLAVLYFSTPAFCAELQMTTYYPAPSGKYRSLTVSSDLSVAGSARIKDLSVEQLGASSATAEICLGSYDCKEVDISGGGACPAGEFVTGGSLAHRELRCCKVRLVACTPAETPIK